MGDELTRSMSLHLEDLDSPYFIQYEVSDGVTHRISASYGALVDSDESRSRVLQSQIRVGLSSFDNSNFTGRDGGRSGLGASVGLPMDDDYLALRQAIWLATDGQFKEAVETLTRKRAYINDRNINDRPADFTKADPVTMVKDPARLPSFNRALWEDYVRKISAQFRNLGHVQNADVSLAFGLENRHLLNSEGTRVRDGHLDALLRITAEGQAVDGQPVSDLLTYYAPTVEQLPVLAKVLADVAALVTRLGEAIGAPILDEYTGPVLFDGLASPQLFRQLLARGFTGQPDPVGAPRRTAQNTEDLDNRMGKRILPTDFQIYDDPRDPKFEDFFLAGHYLVDDEGMPPQRVKIVVDGKLEGMVMLRAPTKFFAQSNGHGRRGGGEAPRAALGCLYIESSKGKSPAELKKALLDAADAEGLKFGLRITGLHSRTGGPEASAASGRFRRGGGARRTLGDPILVYKVYVADGHEEAVRGCEFTSGDMQSLRKILAAGNTRIVQNSVIGTTPSSSLIAPAVVIGEMELVRIKSETEKKPILDPPYARAR